MSERALIVGDVRPSDQIAPKSLNGKSQESLEVTGLMSVTVQADFGTTSPDHSAYRLYVALTGNDTPPGTTIADFKPICMLTNGGAETFAIEETADAVWMHFLVMDGDQVAANGGAKDWIIFTTTSRVLA